MSETTKAKQNKFIYLFTGIILTGMGIYLNFDDVVSGVFPDALMILPLGICNLMMAYLSPHLFPRDERSKAIMGRAMMINYFILFGTILILFLLTGSLGPLSLDATEVLIVLFSIMVLTIPGSMVVYSKLI